MLRKLLAITLIASMAWQGWAWAAPPSATSVEPEAISDEEFEQAVEDLSALAREARPLLDRSQFELEVLLESLDHDAERVTEFVTDEIALEIYPGTLRGARGTLISRAGNALDQALLLATLLKDAGFDAVIRQGKISEAQAAAMVESMAEPRAKAPSIWLQELELRTDRPASTTEAGSDRTTLLHAARATTDQITSSLSVAGVELGSSAVMSQIQNEARDYYWVDYRSRSGEPWRSVHPATGRDPGVEAEATFSAEIPADLTHRVIFELLVVQRRGTKTKESPLMAPLELTSANLVGTPLTITLVPDQFLSQETPLDAKKMASKTRFLLPTVNGELPAGGKALSVRGLLVPFDSLGMGAAGIFETVSENAARAVDALSALGSKQPDEKSGVAIEALRLRVTFRSPDGSNRIAIRELFDEQRDLTPEAIKAKEPGEELVSALALSHSFVLATGSFVQGFVVDSFLEQLESLDPLWEEAEQLDPESCGTLACYSKMKWEAPDPGASTITVEALPGSACR